MKDDKLYQFHVKIDRKNNTVSLIVGGFPSVIEQLRFADLLNNTIKYEKYYLLQAMAKIEELNEIDEMLFGDEKPTIH
jgi:hypothetical protein